MQTFLSATRRDDETFPGIHEDDIPVLEALVVRNIQIYSIFFEEEAEMFAEVSRRLSMKHTKTTSLLRYENQICWTADIKKFLKRFRCYICDQILTCLVNYVIITSQLHHNNVQITSSKRHNYVIMSS